MGILKTAIGAVLGLSVSSPALSGVFTTQSQSFEVLYAEHGSTGAQPFNLYNGPLRLYSVKVTWQGGVGSSFDTQLNDQNYYTQSYSGQVGFYMYSFDVDGFGAYDYREFAGTTQCTLSACSVSGYGSGVIYLDPGMFVGSGVAWVDSADFITPRWDFDSESNAQWGAGTAVTITYTLGPVPEPASWAMMVGGFGLAGGVMRRGRKRPVAIS
jgi:hypothetical protein